MPLLQTPLQFKAADVIELAAESKRADRRYGNFISNNSWTNIVPRVWLVKDETGVYVRSNAFPTSHRSYMIEETDTSNIPNPFSAVIPPQIVELLKTTNARIMAVNHYDGCVAIFPKN